jgi:hypothetical protein
MEMLLSNIKEEPTKSNLEMFTIIIGYLIPNRQALLPQNHKYILIDEF